MRARAALTIAILGIAAVLAAPPARAERLIVSVSNHRVTVTPNYSGEELVLFGSVERDGTTLGMNNIVLTQRVGTDYADVVPTDPFRTAFIRLKSLHGLYRESSSAVTFLTPTLFRTGIPLPAEVPIGTYTVDIKLFADGQLVTRTETAFEIVKVGFEQFVANTSRQNGFTYGLATVAMALMTGWMASIVFRKD